MATFRLGEDRLDCGTLHCLSHQTKPDVVASETARARVKAFRQIVEKKIEGGGTYYGINTGFGLLSDVRISSDKLVELQENYVRAHACAVGEPISVEMSRGLMVLRLHTFLLGHSAIRWELCEFLLKMLVNDILPVVPRKGSVGASGDLAPLAHIALAVVGEGDVYFRGKRVAAPAAFAEIGLKPLKLAAKEGLSITNGTHFMSVLGAFAVEEATRLSEASDVIGAMSLDAFKGTAAAFDQRVHALKAHPGQVAVAARLSRIFAKPDEIMTSHKDCKKVQDPYSFRCMPQVHGACRDALGYVRGVIDRELNSVTDNPLVFEDGSIVSGGNFHGEAVAMAMDFLAIAVSEIGSISEQRIMKLTNPSMSGLPAFLIADSGLNSGFMIPHVVAASLVSENKGLAHPASVDSIPTSADKEDHVSMGPWAARKALKIADNASKVLAIELLAACQGLDLQAPLKASPLIEAVKKEVRKTSPFLTRDRAIGEDIEKISEWLKKGEMRAMMEKHEPGLS